MLIQAIGGAVVGALGAWVDGRAGGPAFWLGLVAWNAGFIAGSEHTRAQLLAALRDRQ